MRARKAFTLIELLVVVSIIALLVSILLPALSRAREQAKFLYCKANLHQYGIGTAMYLHDSDDFFPNPLYWLHSAKTIVRHQPITCLWHDPTALFDGSLWPYLGSHDVHMCPSFLALSLRFGPNHDPPHDPKIPIDPQYSYSMNAYLGSSMSGDRSVAKSTQVKRNPSEILFFTEENLWPVPGISWRVLNDSYFLATSDTCDCIATYHLAPQGKLNDGVGNVLFLDSHVGAERAENSAKLAWPKFGPAPNLY